MVEIAVLKLMELAALYLAAGIVFAIPFLSFWAARMDAVAQNGSWGFRLAILPGTVVLWPLLAIKTIRVLGGNATPPDAEQTAKASYLRRTHGLAVIALAIGVPVVCGAALLNRPRMESSAVELAPVPFPEVIPLALSEDQLFPFELRLRSDGKQNQVELNVKQALQDPVVAIYWSPQESGTSGVPENAVFLGSVWGPARLLFPLPIESSTVPGVLTLVALAGGQHVVASFPLSRK